MQSISMVRQSISSLGRAKETDDMLMAFAGSQVNVVLLSVVLCRWG